MKNDSDMQGVESEAATIDDCSAKNDKKREASSPLQSQFAQPEKKNKQLIESESESDTSFHDMRPIQELDEGQPLDAFDAHQVHVLSRPMNPHDIVQIASELKAMMLPEISAIIQSSIPDFKTIVADAVKDSFKSLNDEVKTLREENVSLKNQNSELEKKVVEVENVNEALEQYGRRNSVRISGVPVRQNEVTDDLVLDIAAALDVPMDMWEIDRSHRVGKATKRNRDILVKFVSYRSRQKLYSRRKELRDNDATTGVFINEDLTQSRSKLLYNARLLTKGDTAIFKAAYSSDGKIFILDKSDTRHLIQSNDSLNKLKQTLQLQEEGQNQGAVNVQNR